MQARRQDLAAGEAKNQKGEHILKILRWIYAATREPNVKWGDRFQMGSQAPLAPPLAMVLLSRRSKFPEKMKNDLGFNE